MEAGIGLHIAHAEAEAQGLGGLFQDTQLAMGQSWTSALGLSAPRTAMDSKNRALGL